MIFASILGFRKVPPLPGRARVPPRLPLAGSARNCTDFAAPSTYFYCTENAAFADSSG